MQRGERRAEAQIPFGRGRLAGFEFWAVPLRPFCATCRTFFAPPGAAYHGVGEETNLTLS